MLLKLEAAKRRRGYWRKPVSPEVAVRLAKLFGNAPLVWIKMQGAYDAWHAAREVDVSAVPTLVAAE